jgi:glycosyltransferase involved in cell wall biosynthesis
MISILLSTYNGENYLKEQLDSLFNQTYQDFKIIVRDDGSTDTTLKILKSYDLEIMSSDKNLGARRSFNALLEYALQKEECKYFMFCDQDDVWMEDKIEKTLQKMREVEKNSDEAVLIHTDLVVVDEMLDTLNNSFWNYQNLNPKNRAFPNFIVQNNITGCTVMINKKLAKLSLPIPAETIMHDWWLGLVASEFGQISYLEERTMLYRQHTSNDTGAKSFNFSFLFENAQKIYKNRKNMLDKYIIQSEKFLEVYHDKLDEDTIKMLKAFCDIKSMSWWSRVMILRKYRLYKQDFFRNMGFMILS